MISVSHEMKFDPFLISLLYRWACIISFLVKPFCVRESISFELNLVLVVRHGLVCSYMYPQIHCNIKKKEEYSLLFYLMHNFFKDPNYLKLNSVLFLQSF